jgi:7-carboxy-7-deazaguanine synthase
MVGIPGVALAQLQVDKPQTLPVAEVFGPTIQGEGPHAGRRCWFLRLGECNLHCAWCDTKFTWDWDNHQREAELEDLTMPEIVGRLRDKGARHGDVVVLTGGEPLIHYNRPAFRALVETGYRWHLESNGTIWPGDKVANAFAHVTLSVKVAQEDDPEKRRIKPGAIARWLKWSEAFSRPVAWKFVVRDGSDLRNVHRLTVKHGIPASQTWIMAEGTDPYKILRTQCALADDVVRRGFNLSTRLHTLVWPDSKKGR